MSQSPFSNTSASDIFVQSAYLLDSIHESGALFGTRSNRETTQALLCAISCLIFEHQASGNEVDHKFIQNALNLSFLCAVSNGEYSSSFSNATRAMVLRYLRLLDGIDIYWDIGTHNVFTFEHHQSASNEASKALYLRFYNPPILAPRDLGKSNKLLQDFMDSLQGAYAFSGA